MTRASSISGPKAGCSRSNQQLDTAHYLKYYSTGKNSHGADVPMHTLPAKDRLGLVQVQQVAAAGLTPQQRERARQCAELLREHLPESFAEAADLVPVW